MGERRTAVHFWNKAPSLLRVSGVLRSRKTGFWHNFGSLNP